MKFNKLVLSIMAVGLYGALNPNGATATEDEEKRQAAFTECIRRHKGLQETTAVDIFRKCVTELGVGTIRRLSGRLLEAMGAEKGEIGRARARRQKEAVEEELRRILQPVQDELGGGIEKAEQQLEAVLLDQQW